MIRVELNGPVPTVPGWYAYSVKHKGMNYFAIERFYRDPEDGKLYYLTEDGDAVCMPTNARWSERIEIEEVR